MKKNTAKKEKYDDDMPSGRWVEVPDFLPPPEELANAKVTITINLDRKTLEFFHKAAKKNGGKYQRMIREVLARYAAYYEKKVA